jgi:hypothetical protein
MGLGTFFTYTPVTSGKVALFFGGMVLNSTAAGDGVTLTARRGTGTPPANGATAGLGTQVGVSQHFIASTTAGQQGWVIFTIVSGLSLNVPVWFDISIIAVTGGGATIKDVQFLAIEL